ncbi:MAG: flavodoxin-dependent (E)-4-hydroxy-3-methylbut-2-enyl-diphosphate synthase [PVC group bacterium]|nr:flavodoxin-dependent (E)-4-hydroxy-3-methylbut-2-enyl-diphosphate synthase [PVC group bacterium]
MKIKRRKTRKIFIGNVPVGGGSPVSIQSMTKTDTRDVAKTVSQIKRLEQAGCQIVRVAVEDEAAARAIAKIKRKIKIPLVADIHFHYKLALLAMENGADKIRLNPGNIQKRSQIEAVVNTAKKYKVPIRIGLNSGSVKRTPKKTLVDDLVAAAVSYRDLFRELKFNKIIFSLKTPDVLTTIEAYRRMAKLTDAPMHLGVTATGLPQNGIIKTSIALGTLLLEGIGDTIRVSLTCDPVDEVIAAREMLQALSLRNFGVEVISCPTCGRCKLDLMNIVKKVEKKLSEIEYRNTKKKITVAVMGCVVNGPGEAKEADIGVAWGGKTGILFKKGKQIRLVNEKELIKTLFEEVSNEMV